MFRSRPRCLLLCAAASLSLGTMGLSGCSAPNGPEFLAADVPQAGQSLSPSLVTGALVSMTDAQADMIMARAIAEHEIRRP